MTELFLFLAHLDYQTHVLPKVLIVAFARGICLNLATLVTKFN